MQKYYEENPEKFRARQKKYREANREKLRVGQKKWREANREKKKAHDKKYYEANREKICAKSKKWRKANPKRSTQYKMNRRRSDPTIRLNHHLGTGVWRCLSGKSTKCRTLEYVGIDIEQLWEHFESKFTDGMTRENYGKWHVDHIRPLCSFDFDQFKEGSEEYENMIHEAWRYTNLQPLWAKDNMSKSGKWEGEL